MSGSAPVIVITGASAGVGRAIALRFARDGARIAAIGRAPEALEATCREIRDLGGEAMALPMDVADAEAVQASARTIAQRWGGIDLWVNNAMVTMFAPLWRMSPQEFRRI